MIPELGRSPGGGHGNPLQYSGLENSMDCIVHGVTKSWTQLSDFHFSLSAEEVLLAFNWVEAMDAAKHPTRHETAPPPPTKNYLALSCG